MRSWVQGQPCKNGAAVLELHLVNSAATRQDATKAHLGAAPVTGLTLVEHACVSCGSSAERGLCSIRSQSDKDLLRRLAVCMVSSCSSGAHLGSNVAAVPGAALCVQQVVHKAAGQAPRGLPVRVCLRACSQETQRCHDWLHQMSVLPSTEQPPQRATVVPPELSCACCAQSELLASTSCQGAQTAPLPIGLEQRGTLHEARSPQ